MSLWSDITHAGSYVLQQTKKSATVYSTSIHDVAQLAGDAASSLGLEDDIDQVTGFIKSKINKNGKAIISHYLDSDGDGVLTKADGLIAKTALAASSLGIFDGLETYAHTLLGQGGSIYMTGLEDANDEAKTAFGYVESDLSSGLWGSIKSGFHTVSGAVTSTTSTVVNGVNTAADWVVS